MASFTGKKYTFVLMCLDSALEITFSTPHFLIGGGVQVLIDFKRNFVTSRTILTAQFFSQILKFSPKAT